MVRSVTLFFAMKIENLFYQASILKLKLVWIELRGIMFWCTEESNLFTISHCDIYAVEVCHKCFRIITVYQFEKCSQIQIMELIHLSKKHVNI